MHRFESGDPNGARKPNKRTVADTYGACFHIRVHYSTKFFALTFFGYSLRFNPFNENNLKARSVTVPLF